MKANVEIKPTYVYLKMQGNLDFQEGKRIIFESIKAAYDGCLDKLLIDVRELSGSLSTMQRYEYGEFLADIIPKYRLDKQNKILRLAFVATPDSIDSKRFAIIVAKNRGVPIMATENYEEAINWLEI